MKKNDQKTNPSTQWLRSREWNSRERETKKKKRCNVNTNSITHNWKVRLNPYWCFIRVDSATMIEHNNNSKRRNEHNKKFFFLNEQMKKLMTKVVCVFFSDTIFSISTLLSLWDEEKKITIFFFTENVGGIIPFPLFWWQKKEIRYILKKKYSLLMWLGWHQKWHKKLIAEAIVKWNRCCINFLNANYYQWFDLSPKRTHQTYKMKICVKFQLRISMKKMKWRRWKKRRIKKKKINLILHAPTAISLLINIIDLL